MPGTSSTATTARNALVYVAIIALVLLLWQTRTLLLLIFGGILIAEILSAPTDWLASRLSIKRRFAFIAVVAGIVIGLGGIGFLTAYRILGEFGELARTLPDAFQKLLDSLPQWVRTELNDLGDINLMRQGFGLFGRVSNVATIMFTAIADLILVLFIGLFLAADPQAHREGLVRLVPKAKQERVRDVLDSCSSVLRRWLLGQLITMLIIGVLSTVGLLFLGIPMAFALGVIAALFEFVPVIGPIASAVPAILISFTVGPEQALWVGLLYLGIQQIESNILQPMVQKWAVELPPVIAIGAAVGFAFVFGLIGIVFAVPLALVVMVLVGKLYMEDALDEDYHGPGGGQAKESGS